VDRRGRNWQAKPGIHRVANAVQLAPRSPAHGEPPCGRISATARCGREWVTNYSAPAAGDAATRGFEAAGHSVSPDRRVHNYNDRRKFKRSCFWEELRLLNFPTTACASEFELQFWLAEVGAFVWGPPKPKPQP